MVLKPLQQCIRSGDVKKFNGLSARRDALNAIIRNNDWKAVGLEMATAVCLKGVRLRICHDRLFSAIVMKYQSEPSPSLLPQIAQCAAGATAETSTIITPLLIHAKDNLNPTTSALKSTFIDLCFAIQGRMLSDTDNRTLREISPKSLPNSQLSKLTYLIAKYQAKTYCSSQLNELQRQLSLRQFENFAHLDVLSAAWGASELGFSQNIFKHACAHIKNFENSDMPYSFLCSGLLNSCTAVGYSSKEVLDTIRISILKRGMSLWKLQHILSLVRFAAERPRAERPHPVLYSIEEEFLRRQAAGEPFAHYTCKILIPSWNTAWGDLLVPPTLGVLTSRRQSQIGEECRTRASLIHNTGGRHNLNPDPQVPYKRFYTAV
eukprot:TRINITY_DN20402_c0_g1_i1.p1 TRINITY_DN20402_c0_g1~~TRINITY_DN20402_c0_g1_i1.p1  ORF type:complete len:377 (+),score=33.28 TRINITY_DN20402_c0_g1_i1:80-1210(+)